MVVIVAGNDTVTFFRERDQDFTPLYLSKFLKMVSCDSQTCVTCNINMYVVFWSCAGEIKNTVL